ncbi:MAG: hypothetical protein Q9168_003571 [Polycauliona sp. 1 TL-2023]
MFSMNSFPRLFVLKSIALVALLWSFCNLTDCRFRQTLVPDQWVSHPIKDTGITAKEYGGDTVGKSTVVLEDDVDEIMGLSVPAALLDEDNADDYGTSVTSDTTVDSDIKTVVEPKEHDNSSSLLCHAPLEDRYSHLRSFASKKPRFFFALDLYQATGILPQLTASILEAVKFLGPQYCYLSIVAGNSTDGTSELLHALHKDTSAINLTYTLIHSSLDPKNPSNDRIDILAQLRNLALAPLLQNPSSFDTQETTIIFINDISPCPNDILELIHQHRIQAAHMACPMDLSDAGLFYDIWVARSMTGDIFFNIPPSGLWEFAKDLLWDDPVRKRRLEAHEPFQVFACWNGMAVISATPFIEKGIRFRRNKEEEGECYMGEPTLLAKDLWKEGVGKIMVVPSVWVAYSARGSVDVKLQKGYVEENVKEVGMAEGMQEMVEWEKEPPARIKCPIPSYSDPQWVLPYEGYVDDAPEKKSEELT